MGLLDMVMDTFFANKNKKFIDAHRVLSHREHLLCVGGILTYVNQHAPQVLLAVDNPKYPTPEMILDSMGLDSVDEVREAVGFLLETGDRETLDPALKAYRGGDRNALEADQQKMLAFVLEMMADPDRRGDEMPELVPATVNAVGTAGAWDIERAAFWARMAFNRKWLSEDETWKILEQAYGMAKKEFSRWSEYLVSFMLGRALIMSAPKHEESMTDVWADGVLMATPKWGEIWGWHPLRR